MSTIVFTYDNLEAMKNASSLSAGMICETLGYYEKGDGGGARYTIEEKATLLPIKWTLLLSIPQPTLLQDL